MSLDKETITMKLKLYNEEVKKILLSPKNSIVVYLCLLVHAGQNNKRLAFPKLDTIENMTGVNRRGIQRALGKLLEMNLIQEVGQTPRGLPKYSLPTYKGEYQMFDPSSLQALQNMTKQGIKNALKNVTPSSKKMTPLQAENVTPSHKNMSPLEAENVTPIIINKLTNNINVNVNKKRKLKMSPLDIPSFIDKDAVLWFSALFEKWSAKKISLWESEDPIKEFIELVSKNRQKLTRKNLIEEIRIFEGYLMEIEIKRSGGLEKEWTDIPCIFAKRGWIKGFDRWLQSDYPSKPSLNRKRLILSCGIKVDTPKEEAAINTPTKPPEDQIQANTPMKITERFTGCDRGSKMFKYLQAKRQESDSWESLYQNISKTHQFNSSDIHLASKYKQLEDLHLILVTSQQVKEVLR